MMRYDMYVCLCIVCMYVCYVPAVTVRPCPSHPTGKEREAASMRFRALCEEERGLAGGEGMQEEKREEKKKKEGVVNS